MKSTLRQVAGNFGAARAQESRGVGGGDGGCIFAPPLSGGLDLLTNTVHHRD